MNFSGGSTGNFVVFAGVSPFLPTARTKKRCERSERWEHGGRLRRRRMTPTLAAIALLTTVNVAISFSPRPNLIWVVPSTMHRRGNLARSSGGQPSVGDRVVVTVVATGPASCSRRYYSAIGEGE